MHLVPNGNIKLEAEMEEDNKTVQIYNRICKESILLLRTKERSALWIPFWTNMADDDSIL